MWIKENDWFWINFYFYNVFLHPSFSATKLPHFYICKQLLYCYIVLIFTLIFCFDHFVQSNWMTRVKQRSSLSIFNSPPVHTTRAPTSWRWLFMHELERKSPDQKNSTLLLLDGNIWNYNNFPWSYLNNWYTKIFEASVHSFHLEILFLTV